MFIQGMRDTLRKEGGVVFDSPQSRENGAPQPGKGCRKPILTRPGHFHFLLPGEGGSRPGGENSCTSCPLCSEM